MYASWLRLACLKGLVVYLGAILDCFVIVLNCFILYIGAGYCSFLGCLFVAGWVVIVDLYLSGWCIVRFF